MAFIGNTNTTQAFTPAIDYFSGNGSTTAFTLSRPVASVAQVQAVVNNVAQNPSDAFTVSGSTITFTSAPSSGTNNIYVYYTSPITQVIAPGQGTVTATSFVSSTGTGAGVFQTSPTITTPVISSLSSASATALTLQSAGTTAITVDTSQQVGIGATPNSKLYIRAATNANLRVTDSSGTLNLSAENDAGSAQVAMKFNGSQMMLDASGNLLVGTTSVPSTGAGTNSTIVSNKDYSAAFAQIINSSSTTGTQSFIQFGRGSSECGKITSTTTNSTTYATSSDYRLKENISPMTGALVRVAALKPVSYRWKSDGTESEGFIAHELAEVVPQAVVGEKDALYEDGTINPQGIDTSFLVATLTAALQELKAINDTQAETINALTARIVALEGR